MKKILCYLLVIIMLVSLCACGSGSNSDDVRGEIVTEGKKDDATEGNIIEETAAPTEKEFSLGKATGDTYRNDFLGVSFTLPEGWEFYSEQQMMQMNNLVGEYMDEDAAALLENANIIYDMMASDPISGSSLNINLEKFTLAQILTMDVKAVLESQIATLIATYENMGYTDVQVNYEKVTVDGNELDGIALSAKIQGIDFYTTIFSFKRGSYLANVSVGSLQTNEVDTILGYFTMD